MISKQPAVLLLTATLLQITSHLVNARTYYEPSQRNIIAFQAEYQGTYGKVYRYSSTDSDSVGSGYSRVDGSNVDGSGASYVRGYSTEYEEETAGLWPNKRVVAGGYERRLRICSIRQYYERNRAHTFHVLNMGNCDDLYRWTSSSSSPTIREVDYIWVSHRSRSVEGTRRFRVAVCQGYNDLIYGTVSTSGTFCSNRDRIVHEFEFHAFGGEVFCPLLDESSDMDIFYTRQHGVRETTALFTCTQGYEITGGRSNRVSCESDGHWDAAIPTCAPIDCGPPPMVDHGMYTGDSHNYQDTVELICDEGFEPSNLYNTLRCQATGHWSQSNIQCLPRYCGPPTTPVHGQVIGTHYTYGDEIRYQCASGYRLQGDRVAVCQANGEWSAVAPTCQEIVCEALLQPRNGQRIGADFGVGATIAFACFDGFELFGAEILRCEQDGDEGVWSQEPPTCEALDCGYPPMPVNGDVDGDSYTFGSRVTFTCDMGYLLVGSESSTCMHEGWDTEAPTCEEIRCRDPGVPEHGLRIGEQFTYHSVVVFTCEGGYTITGSNTIICEETGAWSDRTPRCHAVACPPLPALANGTRVGDVFEYGVTVNFQCFPGFELVGNRSTTCLSSRHWSNSVPNCIPCPIGFYKEGVDGRSCIPCPEFSTTLVQASSSIEHCICQAGTERSDDGQSCVVMQCPPLQAPENGVILDCDIQFGESCSFDCNPGYVLRGRSSTRCGSLGWSDSVPYCQACPANTYKESEGSLTCRPCPRYTHTHGLPGTSLEDCVCRDGFSGEAGGPCADIDECTIDNGGCSEVCDNIQGNYTCSCSTPGHALSDDGHTCYAEHFCEELDANPSHGLLDCRFNSAENGFICFINCNDGYFFVSGQNNYLTCGQETGFEWSHRLVNSSADLPGCTEEFFVDTQLPISFAYDAPIPCEVLVEVETDIVDLITDRVYHLERCTGRCSAINFATTCHDDEEQGSSRLDVSFEILLRNLQEPVGSECDPTCRQLNMREVLGETFHLKTEIQNIVEQDSGQLELEPIENITAVVIDATSFVMGSLEIMCEEPGRVLTRNRQCVPCDAGYYLPRRDDEYCSPCPLGTYQMHPGQTECVLCPEDSTTLTEGASHSTMCSERISIIEGQNGNISGEQDYVTTESPISISDEDIDIDEVLGFL